MAEERWREIPGYDGRYEVSDQGRVRSWARVNSSTHGEPAHLRPYLTGAGYVQYILYKGGEQTHHSAHRLVLLAFVGPSLLTGNHKNGNKQDNRLENLEYVTHRENIQHAIKVLGIQWGQKPSFPKRYEDEELEEILAKAINAYREAQSDA